MWSSNSRLVLGTAAAVALASAPVGAAAEPSPKDKEAAKDAYVEGLELREKGNTAAALEKFQLAYKLVPSPITGLAVARALEELGQFVEARKVYREVAALAPKPSESPEAKAAREQAANNAKELDGKIARLVVIIKGFPAGMEPDEVTVDGKPVAYSKVGTEILVNPGKHVVKASSGSTKKALRAEAVGGESVTVTLDWEQASPAASSDQPPEPPGRTVTNSLVWWGVGLGAVGLGTGIGGFVHWRVNDKECKTFQAASDGNACSDSNLRAQNAGVVVGVVGGVMAATGVALLLYGIANPVPTSATSGRAPTSVWLSASPVGVSLHGRF